MVRIHIVSLAADLLDLFLGDTGVKEETSSLVSPLSFSPLLSESPGVRVSQFVAAPCSRGRRFGVGGKERRKISFSPSFCFSSSSKRTQAGGRLKASLRELRNRVGTSKKKQNLCVSAPSRSDCGYNINYSFFFFGDD